MVSMWSLFLLSKQVAYWRVQGWSRRVRAHTYCVLPRQPLAEVALYWFLFGRSASSGPGRPMPAVAFLTQPLNLVSAGRTQTVNNVGCNHEIHPRCTEDA